MMKVSNQLVAAPVGSDVVIQCYVETSPKAMHSWLKDTGDNLFTFLYNYEYFIIILV